jgi:hypothetical protein
VIVRGELSAENELDFNVGLSLAHSQPWNVGVHQVLSGFRPLKDARRAPVKIGDLLCEGA